MNGSVIRRKYMIARIVLAARLVQLRVTLLRFAWKRIATPLYFGLARQISALTQTYPGLSDEFIVVTPDDFFELPPADDRFGGVNRSVR